MSKDKITIIVPCHNEQEVLPFFLEAVEKVYAKMNSEYGVEFEYMFVDDGSKDKTLSILKDYSTPQAIMLLSLTLTFRTLRSLWKKCIKLLQHLILTMTVLLHAVWTERANQKYVQHLHIHFIKLSVKSLR